MPFLRHRASVCALAALALLAAVALLVRPHAASAHPLGNFTINHYDRIEVSESGIQVYRVLDMAEIPTFQEKQARLDANGDGTIDDAEGESWASAKVTELASNMHLVVNGNERKLLAESHELTFPAGQGGLSLLRLTVTYQASLPDNWRDASPSVQFEDANYGDRLGWREIIVRGGAGVDVRGASVPAEDVSDELLAYPQNSLTSPLDVRKASFSFAPGVGSAAPGRPTRETQAVRGNPDSPLARFEKLVTHDHLGPGFFVLALMAAVGFGALHALSPGHGKTIVAAYLVGSKGTGKHALLLGLTVTATHTSSVYALGFVTLYLSQYVVPERLYPWLSLISGGIIVLMGLSLFYGRFRSSGLFGQGWRWARSRVNGSSSPQQYALATSDAGAMMMSISSSLEPQAVNLASAEHARAEQASTEALAHDRDAAHTHNHDAAHAAGVEDDHDVHTHDPDNAAAHSHGWGPAHSHAIPGQDGESVTWQRLVGLGIFGGLLPCPSAIVVMLGAVAAHRVGFGLLLIVFFSLGLAGVLTGIGFALVYARTITERVPFLGRIAARAESSDGGLLSLAVRALPVVSAAAVVGAGAFVTLRAISTGGFF